MQPWPMDFLTLGQPKQPLQIGKYSIAGLPSAAQARRIFREIPDRGLVDIISYWVLDLIHSPYKSSLDLMLTMSLVVGAFSFWALEPLAILEVDPTTVQDSNKAAMRKKTQLDSPNFVAWRIYITLTKNILKEYHELIGDQHIEDPRTEVRSEHSCTR